MYNQHIIRNSNGIKISGVRDFLKEEYHLEEKYPNGEYKVNWNYLSPVADQDGFDTSKKLEHSIFYKKTIFLPVGTQLIRYGREMGMFTAPKGTRYEELSLPYIKETCEYNEYKVINMDMEVEEWSVEVGFVAPGFDSPGGGIQYLHKLPIHFLLKLKLLERSGSYG